MATISKEINSSPITTTTTIFHCFLLWLPFLLLLPIIFGILLSLAIYKWIVVIFLRTLLKRQDLISPVSGLDVMFSTDEHFRRPYGNLGFVWYLGGPISREIITKRLQTAFSTPPSSSSFHLHHREESSYSADDGYEKLTSVYPTFWLGFPFWKRIQGKFNISEHVKIMRPARSPTGRHPSKFIMHLDDINKLICGWMSEPFAQGRPLWEIRIVEEITFLEEHVSAADLLHRRELDPDDDASSLIAEKIHEKEKAHQVGGESKTQGGFNDGKVKGRVKSILILKTHHMLGDGNSMLRLLDKIIDPPVGPLPPPPSTTKFESSSEGKCELKKVTSNDKEEKLQQQRLQEKLGQNLQRRRKEQAIKRRGGKVTDQQEEEKHADAESGSDDDDDDHSHSNTKSSHFTATYTPGDDNAAAQAIKVRNILLQQERKRKYFGREQESKCYLWWLWRWLKVTLGLSWRQLSNTIYFTFFIPSSIFSLVGDFLFHRDYWFTQKKESERVNWATVCIPMGRLNEIRKNLCKKRTLSPAAAPSSSSPNSEGDGYYYANDESANQSPKTPPEKVEKRLPISSSVPIIVMAVAAVAAALQTLILRESGKFEKSESEAGTDKSRKSNRSTYNNFMRGNEFPNSINRPPMPSPSSSSSMSSFITSSRESFVNFVIALPLWKEHPGKFKFCNFWTHGILKVNMFEKDARSRLHQLNDFYWEMRSRQQPEIYHSLVKIYSLFPKPFLSFMSNYNVGASIGVTNMADSPNPVFIEGQQVHRKYAYFGLQYRHASFTLALLSYNGEMTATILANESVIPDQQSGEKLLRKYFLDEMGLLGEEQQQS